MLSGSSCSTLPLVVLLSLPLLTQTLGIQVSIKSYIAIDYQYHLTSLLPCDTLR